MRNYFSNSAFATTITNVHFNDFSKNTYLSKTYYVIFILLSSKIFCYKFKRRKLFYVILYIERFTINAKCFNLYLNFASFTTVLGNQTTNLASEIQICFRVALNLHNHTKTYTHFSDFYFVAFFLYLAAKCLYFLRILLAS